MMKIFSILLLVTLYVAVPTSAQEQYDNSGKEKINYRRTETNQPAYRTGRLPIPYTQRPKEQVFPLGYGTIHLGKVTTGTGVWTELNPNVPRVDYIGIDFINPDTGWACGGSGAIIKTTNGGNDWTISETPVTNILLKIHSYSGQVVIATGFDGIILRSEDGGESFVEIFSGVGNGTDLWGVQMLNDTLGWVCGMNQTLLKTTDAGLNWQQVFPGLNQHYWSLEFLTEQFGFIVCGGGKVLKTTDGGNNWTIIQAGDTRPLYTIDIIDSLHIAAAGGPFGKNVYSSDGGLTWVQNSDLEYELGANWIQFVDSDTGYITGDITELMKTTDRGQNWIAVDVLFGEGEWQFELLPGMIGYGVGSELKITKTENGYDNWEQLILNFNWNDVFFINEIKGFLISRNFWAGLYKTEDGGLSYQKVENAPAGFDLLFLDSLTGFIGGTHKTTDGGVNWYETNGGGGTKAFFINDTKGWSIGGNVIYKTTDVGENWFAQLTLPADNFTSIFFIDSLNGWATSRYIWQTTDGGTNWIQRTDIPITFSDEIYFIDSVGFVIEFLELHKTTDSGENWFTQLSSQYVIRSFGWMDNQHGFIVGDAIYETNDSGDTWQEILELRNVGLRKFQAPLNYLGYSVGHNGLIYNYIDSSYIPVELISFGGFYENDKIVLHWQTASELNNKGFEIQKSVGGKYWQSIGFVSGRGTSTEYNKYSFTDNYITNEKNYYRLKQVDFDGSFNFSAVIEILVPLENFYLYQNFPNPFNPVTTIKYIVPEKSFIRISLYDIKGEKIDDLIKEEKEKGIYFFEFNNKNLPSGIYFYRITSSSGYSSTKKLIILK